MNEFFKCHIEKVSSDGSKARGGNCDTRIDYYKAMSNIRSKIKLIQNQKISVYLVEDYHLIRKSIKLMVNKAEDISIIGDFDNAEDFLEAFEKVQSDVVIMDLGLPAMNGLCATKILKDKYPEVKIIVLTSHEQTDEVVAALACGANAYCLKDIEAQEIQNIIRSVYKGVMWIHPKVSEAARQSAPKPLSTDFNNLDGNLAAETNLTEREYEVLKKIVDGKTNTQIANDMCISTHTAKAHVGNILSKLAVSDRVEAAVKAVRAKIVD